MLELSELQLPTLSRGTDVAVYTHVTSDHLDRHGTVAALPGREAPARGAGAARRRLVLNDEDAVSRAYVDAGPARTVRYTRGAPPPGGVGIVDGWIVADRLERLAAVGGRQAMTGPGGRVLPLDAIPLPGEHNPSNVAAAVATGLLLGIAPMPSGAPWRSFPGVADRLELVAVVDGVRYVNDSQGTQPDAVIAAVRSFPRAAGAHRGRP